MPTHNNFVFDPEDHPSELVEQHKAQMQEKAEEFMAAVSADDPEMAAWKRYMETEQFANSIHWLNEPEHRHGSMWAAFDEGWRACFSMIFERLSADNERLREIIKGAESTILAYRPNYGTIKDTIAYYGCPFCRQQGKHDPECPGFSARGVVR